MRFVRLHRRPAAGFDELVAARRPGAAPDRLGGELVVAHRPPRRGEQRVVQRELGLEVCAIATLSDLLQYLARLFSQGNGILQYSAGLQSKRDLGLLIVICRHKGARQRHCQHNATSKK